MSLQVAQHWQHAAAALVQAAAKKLESNLDNENPLRTPLIMLHATPGHEEVGSSHQLIEYLAGCACEAVSVCNRTCYITIKRRRTTRIGPFVRRTYIGCCSFNLCGVCCVRR